MEPSGFDPFSFDPFGFIGVTIALSLIVPLLITGAILVVVVWSIRRTVPHEDPAEAELKSRLARGEIDPIEYEVRMRALRGPD